MKIWITGASGLVGRALQAACKERDIHCMQTGRSVDIRSFDSLKKILSDHADISHIINCAAFTDVNGAETTSEEAFQTNVLGTEALAKFAASLGLKLIHLSTDYVFSGSEPKLFREDDLCTPLGVYAKTKREGEMRLLEHLPSACLVRTSWVFGKGGKTFISSLADKLQKEEKLCVVDDQVNRLTYAPDLANTLLSLLKYQGTFHFANQGVASRYRVAQYMRGLLMKKEIPLACKELLPALAADFPQAAPRPLFSALDTQKIEQTLNIAPRPWQEALEEYIHATF